MVEQTAFCIKCGLDTGIEAFHYDTMRNITFIKLNCGHILRVDTKFKFISKREYEEVYGDSE